MRILWASKGHHSTDHNMIEALSRRGHDVHLFTMAEHIREWQVPVHGKVVSNWRGALVGPRQLRSACKEAEPDVILANFVTTYANYAVRARPKAPVVALAWGSDLLLHPRWPHLKRMARRAVRGADCVVANSKLLADRAARWNPARLEMVPYGIPTDLFQPGAPRPADWPRWEGPVLICNRALKPLYDHPTILAALEKLKEVHLVVVGDGPERSRLELRATQLGVAQRVQFVGRISYEELPSWLGAADLWVSAARSDSLPLSILEAYACGLPVVVAQLPQLEDWLFEGVSWTFPAGDANELVTAVQRALDSEVGSEHPGRAAVVERGSIGRSAEEIERICDELLSN